MNPTRIDWLQVIIIVNLLLVLLQTLLALFAWRLFNKVQQVNQELTSHTSGSLFVELYAKIYQQINVTVHAPDQDIVAKAVGEELIINRDLIYRTDLVTNLYIGVALILTQKPFHNLQSEWLLAWFWLLQIIFLLFGITIYPLFMIFSFILGTVLLVVSWYQSNTRSLAQAKIIDITTDLLNLSDSEIVLTKRWLHGWRLAIYKYPLFGIIKLKNLLGG